MDKPSIKPNRECTYHQDGSVSYWSVFKQQWDRTSAYNLTCRHDDFAALNDEERRRISNIALRGRHYE